MIKAEDNYLDKWKKWLKFTHIMLENSNLNFENLNNYNAYHLNGQYPNLALNCPNLQSSKNGYHTCKKEL